MNCSVVGLKEHLEVLNICKCSAQCCCYLGGKTLFCILVLHSTRSCNTQWRKTEDSHYRHVRPTFQTIQLPERGYWWRYRYITSWKLYFMSETSYISFLPDSWYFILPRNTKNFIFCQNNNSHFFVSWINK